MDRVRFGRALGFGTRQAVKTLVSAVDAATAENPSAKTARTGMARMAAMPAAVETAIRPAPPSAAAGSVPPRVPAAAHAAVRKAAGSVQQARRVKQGVRREGMRFGEAVWRPFIRLSGVVWLEVSGVFFGLFALIALGWAWRVRAAWHATAANAADHRRLIGAALMLAVFGHFCVSSFLRARRRERGR